MRLVRFKWLSFKVIKKGSVGFENHKNEDVPHQWQYANFQLCF